MPYLLKVFDGLSGDSSRGNSVADKLNQWMSFNPGVTPMDMTVVWPAGDSSRSSWIATLLYRQGGPAARFWSTVFNALPGGSPEQQVNVFLLNNPTIIPTLTLVIERPKGGAIARSILLVYAVGSWSQVAPGPRTMVGTPLVDVGVSAYGNFGDAGDASRPSASAMNLGNVNWPAGASGFLFSTTSNNPDVDGLAGISPCCFGAPPPPAPPDVPVTPLCGQCFPPHIL